MIRKLEHRDASDTREIRAVALELRNLGDAGEITGYGSVFNTRDMYNDIVLPGAFAKSLAEHRAAGTNPAMLWQHNAEHPIGVWESVEEDAKGLLVRGRIALDTEKGREAHALLKLGAINGLSIGFVATGKTQEKDGTRTVSEIDLWEISLVTFPANRRARVTETRAGEMARLTSFRHAEKALRDAGFADDAAKAFLASVKRMAIEERDAREATARAMEASQRLLSALNS